MDNWLIRTELLLGKNTVNSLADKHILIIGLGGVGAYATEMIARCGIGHLTIADADTVDISNKNRQLLALDSTIGHAKSEVMAQRLKEINSNIKLNVIHEFIRDERTVEILNMASYDYVVDCIDSLSP